MHKKFRLIDSYLIDKTLVAHFWIDPEYVYQGAIIKAIQDDGSDYSDDCFGVCCYVDATNNVTVDGPYYVLGNGNELQFRNWCCSIPKNEIENEAVKLHNARMNNVRC